MKSGRILRQMAALYSQRHHSSQGVAEAFGRVAANNFLKTMDAKYIDTPTICISDPANASSWEWAAGLDCIPQLTIDEMTSISTRADAFQLVADDISGMSGGNKHRYFLSLDK